MTPKISCALIIRDDASTLDACLASIRPHVDELVVVDTGSVDGSPDIARKYADRVEVWLGCNDQHGRIEDFAAARNHSFSLCTNEWVCWFDGDDIVRGGEHLRELAAKAEHDVVRYLFPYEYSHDAQGRVTCLQYRERLMRPRHRVEWSSPVHEMCLPVTPIEGTQADITSDKMVVVHRSSQSTKPRESGRNLRILKSYVGRVGEADPRALYYLGQEYGRAGDIGNSLRYLRRYVHLGHWADERCKALLAMADHYEGLHDYEQAIEWATKAMLERSWPEPYFQIARNFYLLAFKLGEEEKGPLHEHFLRKSAHFAQRGLELPQDVILFANPMDRFAIHLYLNVCLSRLGMYAEAIKSCEAGLAGMPDSAELRKNLGYYQSVQRERGIHALVAEAREAGQISDATEGIIRAALKGQIQVGLLDGPSEAPATESRPSPLAQLEPAPGKLDLIFYVGHGLEPWNPETFEKTGMGGSETMALNMARGLAKLGHAVRLYGHCTPSMEGEKFEGVQFLDASRYRNLECDVLIVSRYPQFVDESYRIKAHARILWVHDVHCGEALTFERTLRFDRILCLSEWHKGYFCSVYPTMDKGLVHVTRNGIDLSRFEGDEPRNPHRAVYSSSPDRGLLTALECWPRIREQVPDAELHIYYGFFNWETTAKLLEQRDQLQNIAHLKHLVRTTPGVVMHDRVSQKELAREFMRSGVWAYPTWFSETSCITAMEAQAAGLHIVTSPVAALKETVGNRGVMIEGDWRSPEYAEAFVAAVVEAMRNGSADRRALAAYAREYFGLPELAAEWDEMLLELHAERTENPMPKFSSPEAAE